MQQRYRSIYSPSTKHRLETLPSREDIHLFYSLINFYYRSNYLGKRFTSAFWFRSLISFLWDLHHHAWLHYCNTIHTPDKTIRIITTAKSTVLNLVDKYILETKILPKNKRLFSACKKLQYQAWNITLLQIFTLLY